MEGVRVMLVGTFAVLLPLQPEITVPSTSALTRKQIVCCRNNDETNRRMYPPRFGVRPERTQLANCPAYELNEIEMSSVEGSVLSVYPAGRYSQAEPAKLKPGMLNLLRCESKRPNGPLTNLYYERRGHYERRDPRASGTANPRLAQSVDGLRQSCYI
jgi:hypothetical protein